MSRGNRISLLEQVKRRDYNITGVKNKISQKESQKIEFITRVLDYALEHKIFSVIDLQNNLGISRNSLDRTIKLLLEKKYIILSTVELKNKKFYKIKSKTQVKKYRSDLHKWNIFKISLEIIFTPKILQTFDKHQRVLIRVNKQIQRNIKKNKFKVRNSYALGKIPFHLKKEYQKQITDVPYPKPVFLKSINATDAFKIIEKYKSYRYCDICLKDGKLINMINISESEVVCIEYGLVFSVIE